MNRPATAVLIVAASGIAVYIAYHLHVVLTPFGLSFALAYLANPLINHFEVRGLRREHLVIVLYLIIVSAISISANFVFPVVGSELLKLQIKIPVYFDNLKTMLVHVQDMIANRLPVGGEIVEHWNLKMYSPWMDHIQDLPGYVLSLFPLLSLIFLVPFITFYLLTDSEKLMRQAIQACPSRYVEQVLHLATEIDVQLGYYVRGIMTEALTVGLLAWIGLLFLHVDYALAISALTAVSSLVPYVGAITSAVVAALVAVYQYGNILIVVKVLILFVFIRMADDVLLQPLIAKHSIRLHPLVYLFALMTGGHSFGFVGLILAVPVACILKALLLVAWDWYVGESALRPPQTSLAPARIPYL